MSAMLQLTIKYKKYTYTDKFFFLFHFFFLSIILNVLLIITTMEKSEINPTVGSKYLFANHGTQFKTATNHIQLTIGISAFIALIRLYSICFDG